MRDVFKVWIVLQLSVSAPVLAQDVLAVDSPVDKVAGDCKFTEGPAEDGAGNVYFSDRPNDRILKVAPGGEVSIYREPSGGANGLIFDRSRRLVMCQHNLRRVSRLESDGSETVLADSYRGEKFIAPNDLCVDLKGRIYFTDPYYGPEAERHEHTPAVYRIDAPGEVARLVISLLKPNGILITPDNKYVYVSDRGTQKLHRFEVLPGGALTPAGIVYDFSPDRGVDGMCLDVRGNIYAAAGDGATTGLFVVSPGGKLLLHKPMPEFSTNVTFGGKDRRDLYLTATTSVYRLRTVNPGIAWPAGFVE
jgi:gluconolactonase